MHEKQACYFNLRTAACMLVYFVLYTLNFETDDSVIYFLMVALSLLPPSSEPFSCSTSLEAAACKAASCKA